MEINSFIREYTSITDEMTRLALQTKRLKNLKNDVRQRLYTYMIKNNIPNIIINNKVHDQSKFESKPRKKPMTKKDKINRSLYFLEMMGIPDPRGFYQAFEENLKNENQNETDRIKSDIQFLMDS